MITDGVNVPSMTMMMMVKVVMEMTVMVKPVLHMAFMILGFLVLKKNWQVVPLALLTQRFGSKVPDTMILGCPSFPSKLPPIHFLYQGTVLMGVLWPNR